MPVRRNLREVLVLCKVQVCCLREDAFCEHAPVATSTRRRFRTTTDSKHSFPIAPNVLNRNFTAHGPDQVWVTDIAYLWTTQGWLYLAVILDLFSRRVVGWATSQNVDRHLALAALDMALVHRRPSGELVHHSDRGSTYASTDYRDALESRGIECSMSRKGTAGITPSPRASSQR